MEQYSQKVKWMVCQVLAEGEWELVLNIPVYKAKRIRQWTKVSLDGENYHVTSVELTSLGVRISAVKSVPLPALGEEDNWSKQFPVL